MFCVQGKGTDCKGNSKKTCRELVEKRYDINLKDLALTIKNKENEVIAKVDMSKNRLFTLNIKTDSVKCFKAILKDSSWLWHLRFGHLGFSGLKLLWKTKMVKGLPEMNHPNKILEGCIMGKQHRKSFPVGKSWRASRPLQLVHTDIAGPFGVISNGGN